MCVLPDLHVLACMEMLWGAGHVYRDCLLPDEKALACTLTPPWHGRRGRTTTCPARSAARPTRT